MADKFTTQDIREAVEVARANDATVHGRGCGKPNGDGVYGPGCYVPVPIDPGSPLGEAIAAKVIEVAATPLDALGFAETTSINLGLGEDRKAFVFTISRRARDAMVAESPDKLGEVATALGALVHPSSAVLVVLPDGEQLSAYRVEVAE